MVYNLANYRYKDGKIYVQKWWIFFTCIDEGPYSFMEGVKIVNRLAGAE